MALGFTPYLMFNGTAREAMTYYAEVFGGELDLLTYGEGMGVDDDSQDRIMHSSLYLERGAHIMGADLFPGQVANGLGTISLTSSDETADDNARIAQWWERFAPEAEISIPLEAAPWNPEDRFGQLKDKFGVEWMFILGSQ
ncbi:VOC family protein [Nesterenkonia alba]|uniref:VOC family protein n=1 Tax=Nesterenkonia alba TaxID=515814 RepID=UPI0003B35FE6|nr:VOC family protein [Nesterenkonia alba]